MWAKTRDTKRLKQRESPEGRMAGITSEGTDREKVEGERERTKERGNERKKGDEAMHPTLL